MDQPAKVGRKGIDESLYSEQITKWLSDGLSLDDISATSLQKSVGGQYKKAVTALDRYKEAYEAKALADIPPIPQAVTDELNSYAVKLWREVNQATHDKIAEAQAAAQADVEAAEARQAESLNMIESLETDLEKSEQNNEALARSLKATESSLIAKSESVAALQADKSHLTEQLNILREELQQARTENKATESSRQALAEQLGIERASNESLKEQVKEAKERIQVLTADLSTARQQSEESRVKVEDIQKAARDLADTLKDVKAELAQERVALRNAKAENKALTADNTKHAKQLQSLGDEVTALNADKASIAATADQYKERYQAAEKAAADLQKDLLALAKKQK